MPEKRLQLFVTHLREFLGEVSRGRKAHGYIHPAQRGVTMSRPVRKKSRHGRSPARAAPLEAIWGWAKSSPRGAFFADLGVPKGGFP